jgi:hypothetical protein
MHRSGTGVKELALVRRSGTDAQEWHWCEGLALVRRSGTGAQEWHWCQGLALVHKRGTGVNEWHWCEGIGILVFLNSLRFIQSVA